MNTEIERYLPLPILLWLSEVTKPWGDGKSIVAGDSNPIGEFVCNAGEIEFENMYGEIPFDDPQDAMGCLCL